MRAARNTYPFACLSRAATADGGTETHAQEASVSAAVVRATSIPVVVATKRPSQKGATAPARITASTVREDAFIRLTTVEVQCKVRCCGEQSPTSGAESAVAERRLQSGDNNARPDNGGDLVPQARRNLWRAARCFELLRAHTRRISASSSRRVFTRPRLAAAVRLQDSRQLRINLVARRPAPACLVGVDADAAIVLVNRGTRRPARSALMKNTQRQLSIPVSTPPSSTPAVMPSADIAP